MPFFLAFFYYNEKDPDLRIGLLKKASDYIPNFYIEC
jgi:hypothetical protein